MPPAENRVLVTGSSGFIGTHLCSSLLRAGYNRKNVFGLDFVLPPSTPEYNSLLVDIRSSDALLKAADAVEPDVIIHLAAKAEVVIPFSGLPDLIDTNINGTIKVLDIMRPKKFIFASSSSVYGNTGMRGVSSDWSNVCPIGTYATSKVAGEIICGEWAKETGGSVVSFRFGNVIGEGCRGLIPYLVNHALKYPDGSYPAQLRGRGAIVRDYVPVNYVNQVIMAAAREHWEGGTFNVFNIGTGRGMTNADVASLVQRVLERQGYKLRLNFDNPIAFGESNKVALDARLTVRQFGIPLPRPEHVVEAIEHATIYYLKH